MSWLFLLIFMGLMFEDSPVPSLERPDWVQGVSRMAFGGWGDLELAEQSGVQVFHTNLIWPYYPLRREGGGLAPEDVRKLRELVEDCHRRGMKLSLGVPPFPSVSCVKAHPDWRVDPDGSGRAFSVEPREAELGSRLGCNLGPWGDYFIELLAELVADYDIDGFSFDGNYHPAMCYCKSWRTAYRAETGENLPKAVNLDELDYRRYLVWRGEKLEQHYAKMQKRIKATVPSTVLMSWTVNAGRYGHLLTSPRAMPTRLNRLFDLPMQEWWQDETNLGASVAPAFGAAYLRATVGGGPNASEPYLMTRGDPYGSDSFPRAERLFRSMLALTNGSLPASSFGFAGHRESTREVFEAIQRRERWITRSRPFPWAAMLVSEQTRQFHDYPNVADRFLPRVYGVFRAAMEEHWPLDLINDWDATSLEALKRFRVVILPNVVAVSDAQARTLRSYVEQGGGLVVTGCTSLKDELGRSRDRLALGETLGVAVSIDNPRDDSAPRLGQLSWVDERVWSTDGRLKELVPQRRAIIKSPFTMVKLNSPDVEVLLRWNSREQTTNPAGGEVSWPAVMARKVGQGRVVYLATGLDAALWSYAYPYQRVLLSLLVAKAAGGPPPIQVEAPMAVQSTIFEQQPPTGGPGRVIVHLFNGLNSTSGHGLPKFETPLREEVIPISGIRARFAEPAPRTFHIEPGNVIPRVERTQGQVSVEVPPLGIHAMVVGEW